MRDLYDNDIIVYTDFRADLWAIHMAWDICMVLMSMCTMDVNVCNDMNMYHDHRADLWAIRMAWDICMAVMSKCTMTVELTSERCIWQGCECVQWYEHVPWPQSSLMSYTYGMRYMHGSNANMYYDCRADLWEIYMTMIWICIMTIGLTYEQYT